MAAIIKEMAVGFIAGYLAGLMANWTYDLLKIHFQKKDDP